MKRDTPVRSRAIDSEMTKPRTRRTWAKISGFSGSIVQCHTLRHCGVSSSDVMARRRAGHPDDEHSFPSNNTRPQRDGPLLRAMTREGPELVEGSPAVRPGGDLPTARRARQRIGDRAVFDDGLALHLVA